MDYQAKQKARAVAIAALQAANPKLVPGADVVTAAKNIRIELKAAFPTTKFYVTTSKFSMGNSLRVRWIDGPNVQQVEEITDKYSGGDFDGMTDSYTYADDRWIDAFGSAKYLHTDREDSDKALTSAIRTVMDSYAGNLRTMGITELNAETFCKGGYMQTYPMGESDYWSLQNLIRRTAAKRTWALNKTPKALPMVEEEGTTV
jgi:hypothetical protein